MFYLSFSSGPNNYNQIPVKRKTLANLLSFIFLCALFFGDFHARTSALALSHPFFALELLSNVQLWIGVVSGTNWERRSLFSAINMLWAEQFSDFVIEQIQRESRHNWKGGTAKGWCNLSTPHQEEKDDLFFFFQYCEEQENVVQ